MQRTRGRLGIVQSGYRLEAIGLVRGIAYASDLPQPHLRGCREGERARIGMSGAGMASSALSPCHSEPAEESKPLTFDAARPQVVCPLRLGEIRGMSPEANARRSQALPALRGGRPAVTGVEDE